MSEVLFILTTIFVAYVVYTVVNELKAPAKVAEKPVKPAEPLLAVVTEQAAASTAQPVTVGATEQTSASTAQNVGKGELRNPKTGEVASAHSNYRFTKRWIKEALVEEGLVEKVYKNNELDETVEGKIKDALLKLEAIDKYKA